MSLQRVNDPAGCGETFHWRIPASGVGSGHYCVGGKLYQPWDACRNRGRTVDSAGVGRYVFCDALIRDRLAQNLSLGSLILALGLLVDDAIIAVEMMAVKMEEGWDRVKAASFAYSTTAIRAYRHIGDGSGVYRLLPRNRRWGNLPARFFRWSRLR